MTGRPSIVGEKLHAGESDHGQQPGDRVGSPQAVFGRNVLVHQPHDHDRDGREGDVVEGLVPVVVEALAGVGSVDVEPKLRQRVRDVLLGGMQAGSEARSSSCL